MNTRHNSAVVFWVVFLLGTTLSATCHQMASAQDTALYFFTSSGCPPCRQMEPVIQDIKRQGFRVFKIDVNEQPKWAKHFGVSSTPTSIIVSNNLIYGRQRGVISSQRLAQALQKATQLAKAAPQTGTLPTHAAQQQRSLPTQRPVAKTTTVSNANTYVSTNRISPKKRAHRATVRLRVEDPEGISHGTGTIIHVKDQHALVLTCGHIFRDSQGRGTISVDYGFADGRTQTARGRLLASDWESRDVAILTFDLGYSIEPAPMASSSFLPRRGEAAFSVGCSHGKPPTIQDCQVKKTARYGLGNNPLMAMKIDTTVQPADGRSGGGLFDSQGRLIGVCNAAAQDEDEGIYTSLENVFWQLEKNRLAGLFNNQPQQRRPTQIVSNPANQNSQQEEWLITVKSLQTGQSFTIRNPSSLLLERIAAESSRDSNQRIATRPDQMPDVGGISPRKDQRYRAQSPR